MAKLTTSNGQFAQTFTVNQKTGSYILLSTANKYLDKDIKITTTVKTGQLSTSGTASASISGLTFTYNSSSEKFDITGSGSISGTATTTVGTAGWIASGSTGSISGTASLSGVTVSKIAIESTNSVPSGKAALVTPQISKQSTPSGVTNAATSDNATTTAPSSGVYVAVKSAENKTTLTSTPSVVTKGYGETAIGTYIATNGTTEVGANASATTYIKIKTANPTFTGGTLTVSSSMTSSPNTNSYLTISDTDTCGAYITSTGSASRAAVTYNGAVDGYVIKSSGTTALAATTSNTTQTTATKKYINGIKIFSPSSSTRYFDITIPNGSTTDFITFRFTVDNQGNVTVTAPTE